MIPELSSKELNNILQQAQNKIVQIDSDVANMKQDILNKMAVIKNEEEYAAQMLLNLQEQIGQAGIIKDITNKVVFAKAADLGGSFDSFGSTVHAKFLKAPTNIFNFITSSGPIFKDNMSVSINGNISAANKEMLKHNGIANKGITFAEYDSPNIVVEIAVNTGDLLGDTLFNAIEINPFMAGSFSIDKIEVYSLQSQITGDTQADHEITTVGKVGPCRIFMDTKYNLYKLRLTITVNYQNRAGKYPFGIKHLYLYNADCDQNSYAVAKITKSQFIDWISDQITIHGQGGFSSTTTEALGINLYLNYTDGVLEYNVPVSSGYEQIELARNTKEIYAQIPLTNSGLISLEFAQISER